MARILVLGAGLGGLPAAYELRRALAGEHTVTLINAADHFQFTPSNPWVAVGWRTPQQVSVSIRAAVEKKGIEFIAEAARAIDADHNSILLASGRAVTYDYLVIATGPKLAFDEVPGLGPDGNTVSVCTTPHAVHAFERYQQFLENPGPVVIGAAAGASCFGPAYEFALILDADLRKRRLRNKVPITFVTPEPYIGHMGLGGVGDSKGLLESELRQRHIKWLTNAKVLEIGATSMRVAEHGDQGQVLREHTLPHTSACSFQPSKASMRLRQCPGCAIRAASSSSTSTSAVPSIAISTRPASASPFPRSSQRPCRRARRRPAT